MDTTLIDKIFPNGVKEDDTKVIADVIIFAIKNRDSSAWEKAGLMLIDKQIIDWGKHCINIAHRLDKQKEKIKNATV